MKICHLFPVGCPLITPHVVRSFAVRHEQMGTKLDDHCFIIPGASPEEQRTVYGNLGVPAEQVVFLELRPRTLARFFGSLDGHALLVLHSIFSSVIWAALALRPGLWRRTVWVMWGADVYGFSKVPECPTSPRGLYRYAREMIHRLPRKSIIRRLGAVAGAVPGDFDVLQSQCGKLRNYRRLIYANVALDPLPPTLDTRCTIGELRICLGNSATPSNGHLEAMEWLGRFRNENIAVFCPLNYGDSGYRETVLDAGRAALGEKFHPLLEVLDRDKYIDLLKSLDVLVFNHNRQQGLFALFTMLFAGKKCFVRSDVSVYAMLRDFGIQVFPTETIASQSFADFSKPLPAESVDANRRQCQRHLSSDAATETWRELFAYFTDTLALRR